MTAATSMHIGIDLSEDLQALLASTTDDTLEKVNAGAQLVHALYHCPAEVVTSLPEHVLVAYMRAQIAYGVGGARRDPDDGPFPVRVAESPDPVKYVNSGGKEMAHGDAG